MYKRILIPMDCTSVDDLILNEIINLSGREYSPEVFLLHVLHVHTRDGLSFAQAESLSFMQKAKKILEDRGIRATVLQEFGDPEDLIVEKSKELNCDLIAFATHGHRGFMDFLLGSVVAKVRHRTNLPILLIKKH